MVAQMDPIPFSLQKSYEKSIISDALPHKHSLLEHFGECMRKFSTVYMVLDACDRDEQDSIIGLIEDLRNMAGSTVKTMLTSRPHLSNIQTLSRSAITLQITANNSDIHTYLCARLKNEQFLSPELKQEIVAKIAQGAKGM
jgi:hypothetical protein